MFTNLLAEAARYSISRRKMQEVAGISSKSLNNKIAGRTQFKVEEMKKIRDVFPVHFSLDELFKQG